MALIDAGLLLPKTDLNRFAARYRTATALQSVNFSGISTQTSEGYSVAFKMAFSYSALEALEKSIGTFSRKTDIQNSSLANELRELGRNSLIPLLLEDITNGKLLKRLTDFESGVHDDLRPIAESVRHLTFHGSLTPHGAGLTRSKKLRIAIEKTANVVLSKTDEEFALWLDRVSEEAIS